MRGVTLTTITATTSHLYNNVDFYNCKDPAITKVLVHYYELCWSIQSCQHIKDHKEVIDENLHMTMHQEHKV